MTPIDDNLPIDDNGADGQPLRFLSREEIIARLREAGLVPASELTPEPEPVIYGGPPSFDGPEPWDEEPEPCIYGPPPGLDCDTDYDPASGLDPSPDLNAAPDIMPDDIV